MEYFLLACILIEGWMLRRMWVRVKGNAMLANENFVNIAKCLNAFDSTMKLEIPLLKEIIERVQVIEEKQQNQPYIQ